MRKQVTYLGNILCYEIENLNKPVCICFHGMNMTPTTVPPLCIWQCWHWV